MNGAILSEMPERVFNDLVDQAFRLLRDGSVLELSRSPLAQSSLVEDCLATEGLARPAGRGAALQSVLRWAVDRLRADPNDGEKTYGLGACGARIVSRAQPKSDGLKVK